MAKVAIKSGNITPFGGIFYSTDIFRRIGLADLIDQRLGLRSKLFGYQYSEIFNAVFCTYLCGGDHIEDIMYLGEHLRLEPDMRVPSSDTIARGMKELACEGTTYTSDSSAAYLHDYNARLNSLLVEMAVRMGLLERGKCIDVDFDNEFIPAEKKDALYSYKQERGYFPGVLTSGPLILGIENRQGNSGVKFHQVDAIRQMIMCLLQHGMGIRMFRADCGSFIKELVELLWLHSEVFYLRASSCQSRLTMYGGCDSWRKTTVNDIDMEVASFEFTDFMPDYHMRLVVQRTQKEDGSGQAWLPEMGYVYRAILTNDHDSTEEEVIGTYNKRGGSERNFDQQNNDFGWAHLPFSKLQQNTVFLLITAMLKNFYVFMLRTLGRIFPGIDEKCRLKRFIFNFISVPAKWVKTGREWVLNIYAQKRWLHYWSLFNLK